MARSRTARKGWLAHYSELIGAWTQRSPSRQDAEDAVQDAALAILEGDGRAIRDEGNYFRRAVFNRSVSLHRAESLRKAQSLDEVPDDMHPVAASAQAICEADQLGQVVLRALGELPDSCQIAFRLRQIEGLSNGEIAQRMGVTRNMVERYMMRTTRHLQDKLQENGC